MLAGGLSTGSATLLLGPAGVGKSTEAMLFALSALEETREGYRRVDFKTQSLH
jgi:KaiC/GvpD/RAD55 family RecA-like ATPase